MGRQAGVAPYVTEQTPLTYAALPWATHPIDTAPLQPQGWGPMSGPWQPVQYADPAAIIDVMWTQTNNINTLTAPPYQYETLYSDPSLGFVANLSAFAQQAQQVEDAAVSETSTIANAIAGKRGLGRMLTALGLGS